MKRFAHTNFDAERALYGISNAYIYECTFSGPADGESALKECEGIIVDKSHFYLRYPFWHDKNLKISSSEMYETCRAPLWYSENIHICNSKLHGVKALRECKTVSIEECDIISSEFGWFTYGVSVNKSSAEGEYLFMRSKKLTFSDFEMKGKYSFQYVEDAVFENCNLDTKDALWHAKNVHLKNCTVKGEYLAWYCENVTFEDCTIIGTQPLCYCKKLKLINCEMKDTDLAFEKSDVNASIKSSVVSIKNPLKGKITLPSVGEIIMDAPWAKGKIILSD